MITLAGCGSVSVLKTGKGFYQPTKSGEIDVLTTRPDNKFEELGVISANGFDVDEMGKIHNALRDKASTLGADAVVITSQGQVNDGWGVKRWAEATAIKWIKN